MTSASHFRQPQRPQRRPHPTGFVIDAGNGASQQTPRPERPREPKQKPARPAWHTACVHFANACMVAINSLVAIGLLVSAYSQRIDPVAHPNSSIVSMSFGFWLWIMLMLFIIDLLWWKRTTWIAGLAMLACVGNINAYMPLNLPHLSMSASDKAKSFTVMTYNVAGWNDNQGVDVGYNRQLEFILKQNADITCIQEAHFMAPTPENHIRQYQIDSMHTAYPYILTQGHDFAILSKYPVEPINLDFPTEDFKSGGIAAWRTEIDGQVVNIFSVHLRSFSLSDKDKSTYEELVKIDSRPTRTELRTAKADILPKVASAAVERAKQIALLQKYLQRYGGKNAIVMGDFNDTDNSYGIYKLCSESRMHQVFEEAGFGAAHTFHDNYLFFRIDHILFRGNMRPYSVRCSSIKASDHYPLKATFIMTTPGQ